MFWQLFPPTPLPAQAGSNQSQRTIQKCVWIYENQVDIDGVGQIEAWKKHQTQTWRGFSGNVAAFVKPMNITTNAACFQGPRLSSHTACRACARLWLAVGNAIKLCSGERTQQDTFHSGPDWTLICALFACLDRRPKTLTGNMRCYICGVHSRNCKTIRFSPFYGTIYLNI